MFDLGSPTVSSLDGKWPLKPNCIFHDYTHYSHGEALTFEPLLMEDRDQSPLKDYFIVAIATVTQVCSTHNFFFFAKLIKSFR